jgi:hypothetical protein
MLTLIEYKGYFWTPQNAQERLPGTLRFDPDSEISVELWGRFSKYKNPSSLKNNILLGFTSCGKKITLLNCFEYSKGMSIPGFAVSSFSAIFMFVGGHFASVEEMLFKSVRVEYEDVNHWLGISGFARPKLEKDNKKVVLEYAQPERIPLVINEQWEAAIEFDFQRPSEYFTPTSVAKIEQLPAINFAPKSPQRFETFHDMYQTFSSLLALCYFGYPTILTIVFTCPNPDLSVKEEPLTDVSLYYASKRLGEERAERSNKHNFLIQFGDIDFSIIVQRWYLLYEKIEATIDILSENLMSRGTMPTEFRFLSYAQALENMHRKLAGGSVHLKARLDGILMSLPGPVREALLEDEPEFAFRIKEHRNFFTHYNNGGGYVKPALGELHILSEKMKIVLITYLLQALELNTTIIQNIILSKGQYLFNHLIKRKA